MIPAGANAFRVCECTSQDEPSLTESLALLASHKAMR